MHELFRQGVSFASFPPAPSFVLRGSSHCSTLVLFRFPDPYLPLFIDSSFHSACQGFYSLFATHLRVLNEGPFVLWGRGMTIS